MKTVHVVIIVLVIIAVFFYFKNKKDAAKMEGLKYPDLTPEQWLLNQKMFGRGIVAPTKNEQDQYNYYLNKYGATLNEVKPTMNKYNRTKLPKDLLNMANSMRVATGFDWNAFYENWLVKNGYGNNLKQFTDSF